MPNNAGEAESGGKEKTALSQVVLALYQHSRLVVISNIVTAAVLTIFSWSRVPDAYLLGWFGIMTLSVAARYVLMYGYFREHSRRSSRIWGLLFALGSFFTGLVWGSFAVFLYLFPDPAMEQVAIFIVIGMTSGAAAATSVYLPAARAFFVATLSPYFLYFLVGPNQEFTLLAILFFVFGFFLDRNAALAQKNALKLFGLQKQHETLRNEHKKVEGRVMAYEKQLSGSVALLQEALNASHDGIALFDSEGRLVAHNKAFADWFFPQHGSALVIGRKYTKILDEYFQRTRPDLTKKKRKDLARQRLAGMSGEGISYEYRLEDGRWVLVTEKLTTSGGIISQAVDISALKARESELSEARDDAEAGSRAKSAFLATMSHEIRTPLNGIVGMSKLLMKTRLVAEQREFATHIQKSGETLLEIINDLLDYSKLDAGKMTVETRPLDMVELVDRVIEILLPEAKEKNLNVATILDPRLPRKIMSDPARLRQIFLNLLGNAIKFTRTGAVSVCVVSLGETDGVHQLRIEVQDTGVGIPEDAIPMLFDEFTQADSSTTREFGGTGLGLAICKRLTELMGGTIGVESEPGKGSLFWVEFSASSAAEPLAAEIGGFSDLPCVLIADVDYLRLPLKAQLDAWSMKVEAYEDLQAAEDSLRSVLTGANKGIVLLAGSNAIADTNALLARAPARTAPDRLLTIFTPGSANKQKDIAASPLQHFLLTPVSHDQLRSKIAEILGVEKATPEDDPQDKTAGRDKGAKARPLKILVAEDNRVNQLLIIRLLAKVGHEIILAEDGAEAIKLAESSDVDLILMDVKMPGMSGIEASRQIRALGGHFKDIPVAILTADLDTEHAAALADLGISELLTKPLDRDQLSALIEKLGGIALAVEDIAPKPAEPEDQSALKDLLTQIGKAS